ncbi:NAD(P)-binding protein [Ramaria rubella]|nr:NAD(P)-binding protein [Ramaria rubella]
MAPNTTKALVLERSTDRKFPIFHNARIVQRPIPPLKDSEVLVQMGAVAFNHRDLWLRKNQYPGISLGTVLGADGAGTVVDSGRPNDALIQRRVFLTPSRGWKSDPMGPEGEFAVIGGVKASAIGTFSEYVVVERDEILETPDHLDDEHAAAWPLAGVTAWRALNHQAQVQKGHNILITGIGGGVAIVAQQLAIALGVNVYVTSGSANKITKAIAMGAKGGFNYRSESWPSELSKLLKEQNATLDAVIDSAGGDILSQTSKLMKPGGKLVCYGMTASPGITFTMREVLNNIELKGTAMGSQRELNEATDFITDHKIIPVVSDILDGLESFEQGFEMMEQGSQFGKIVMRIHKDSKGRL